jgi:hypothetical protein
MSGKPKSKLEQHVDGFLTVCERIALRTLMFSCFIYEVSRFARWMWMKR